MNAQFKILLAALLATQFSFVPPCRAADVVSIDQKYKRDSLYAPEPEFPIAAQNRGRQGQGIYRLIINEKTGMVDEVKILRSTGFHELDASAVMTFFKWKFRPGATKQRDVAVNFHLTGSVRGLH